MVKYHTDSLCEGNEMHSKTVGRYDKRNEWKRVLDKVIERPRSPSDYKSVRV